jgi:hypothetical protein
MEPCSLISIRTCTHPTPHTLPETNHQGFINRSLSPFNLRSRTGISDDTAMTQFRQKPGTRSIVHRLKQPLPDVTAFDAVVRSLVLKNPLGCTSYRSAKKHHPPVETIRETYTAKFSYRDEKGKRIGSSSETYNSLEGYLTGIAAVISNMANIASHCGKVKHLPEADLFSVTLDCRDPGGELYFLSIARNRITLFSYGDDEIRKKVEQWTDGVPALA